MRNVYEDYYLQQAGTGLPIFVGARSQRGHGLLSGLARMVIPLLKSGGKALLKQGVQTGKEILGDVLSGQNIKKAARQRVKQGGQRLLQQATRGMLGHGRQKKRPAPPGEPAIKIKRRRVKQNHQSAGRGRSRRAAAAVVGSGDIFD